MPVYERVLAQLASFDLTEAEGARVHSLSSGLRRVKPPFVSSEGLKRCEELRVGSPLCVFPMGWL